MQQQGQTAQQLEDGQHEQAGDGAWLLFSAVRRLNILRRRLDEPHSHAGERYPIPVFQIGGHPDRLPVDGDAAL